MLYRVDGGEVDGAADLLMLGWSTGYWHLELTHNAKAATRPEPTREDLLVLYLDAAVRARLVRILVDAGGRRVAAHNPYWDQWSVTIEDPDGYRQVLCERSWSNADAYAAR